MFLCSICLCTASATTELYTLSLHDALPISTEHPLTRVAKTAIGAFSEFLTRDMALIALAFVVLYKFTDAFAGEKLGEGDRKSTRLNSSHTVISYAVFCLKKKKQTKSRACTS